MKYLYSSLLIAVLVLAMANGAKILGIFNLPLTSHQKLFLNLAKELSLKGHEVTIIAPNSLNDTTLKNLTEIDISYVYTATNMSVLSKTFEPTLLNYIRKVHLYREFLDSLSEAGLNVKEVQDLIKSDRKFDVVLVEPHDATCFAFGARFNAPIVAISSIGVTSDIHDFMGNPAHPVLAPDFFATYIVSTHVPFSIRLDAFLKNIWYSATYRWYFLPKMNKLVKKYFGENFPPLEDIIPQTSLLLTTTNPVMDIVRPTIPTVINVEQLNIERPKPLPKDIKKFLDSAENGAVYFSLGTNILSSNLKNDLLAGIVKTFKNLPYKVLWKFEKDLLPIVSDNVLIKKWFPQQDVLSHPNIKVFVTQGGYQSIEEAINKEVPMVGIPFVADQPKNVKKLVKLGMALHVCHTNLTQNILGNNIIRVATDPSFKENVVKYKTIIEDQPLIGINKAIWWIEYVIRHNGTEHLRYPGRDMPLYKYLMLDVISFLLFVVLLFTYMFSTIMSFLRKNIFYQKHKVD